MSVDIPPFSTPNAFVQGADSDANTMNANFSSLQAFLNAYLVPFGAVNLMASNASAAASGSANVATIQTDLTNLIAGGGGVYVLPDEVINVTGTITVGGPSGSPVYAPVAIIGASRASYLVQNNNVDTFFVNINQGGSGQLDYAGMLFQGFNIKYVSGSTSGAGIHIISGQHICIDQMFIHDAPIAVWAEQCLQNSILRCLFKYDNNTTPTGFGMVTYGNAAVHQNSGIECNMTDCTLYSTDINNGGPGGTAIWAQQFEHIRLMNLRLEGHQQGVVISPSNQSGIMALKVHMEDIYAEVGTNVANAQRGAAFAICPQNGLSVYQVTMISCISQGQTGGGTQYTGGGLVIDTSGAYLGTTNTGSTIDKIRIVQPMFTGWNGPGISITNGSGNTINQVQIMGGHISKCGQTQTGAQGSGIYAVGTIGKLSVRGTTIDNLDSIVTGAHQTYGIYFDTGANGEVSDCELIGNNTAPIGNAGSPYPNVVNCPGYNTQLTTNNLISTSVPTTTTVVSASATHGYFGPSVVYINCAGSAAVSFIYQGYNTGSLQAVAANPTGVVTLYLGPGESFSITYTSAPILTWIGK